jgi:predicted dehydrogenase
MRCAVQKDAVKCGVIGVGIMGSLHTEYLAGRRNVRLVTVADVRYEVAEKTAAKTDCQPYRDYEHMLAGEALDLVLVAMPDPFIANHLLPAARPTSTTW